MTTPAPGAPDPSAPEPIGDHGLLGSAVRRPVAVLMMVLAVVVFGLVSLGKLPVNLLPDVSYPTLTVRTEYEGAAPIDVEKLVTRPLEEDLAVISDLVAFRSISRAGVSDLILEFAWDTPMAFAAQDVREKVDQVMTRLPEGIERPLILRYDPTLDPILRIALFDAGESDLYRLRRIADEEIKRQLENIPGVAAVRVRGGFEEEWRIELEERLLEQRGVTSTEVIERVGLENANVAGGILRDGDRESLVRTLGEITTPEELSELVVTVKGSYPVRVRDVGRVAVGHKERDVITRIEGKESVELEIFKEAEANIVQVAHAVKRRLFGPDWRERLSFGDYRPPEEPSGPDPADDGSAAPDGEDAPLVAGGEPLAQALGTEGIRTRVLSDPSVFIESSIAEVRDAAIAGALLAIAVLYLFLRRIGPTLIIGVAIPVSVVATFAPLYLAGVSLNIMSLGGLALGVGMLVDAAIVVLEAITRQREEGAGIVTSAIAGTREVGLAVLASTLTTVAVFLPIVFVEGVAGEFFRDQALVVVFSLLASLIAALFFIPMLASRQPGAVGRGAREAGRRALEDWAPWRFDRYVAARAIAGHWRAGRTLPGKLLRLPLIVLEAVLRFPFELAGRVVLALLVVVAVLVVAPLRLVARLVRIVLGPPLALFDRVHRGGERLLAGTIRGALRARFLVIMLAALLGVAAAIRVPDLGVELVPKVHQGELTIETQLDVGTPVERTDEVTRSIADAVRRAFVTEGLPLGGLSSAAGVDRYVIAKAGDGQHTSRVHVRLGTTEDLRDAEERVVRAIRRELALLPEVTEPIFTRPALFTTRTALEVEVLGPELGRIERAAAMIEEGLQSLPKLTDIRSTHRSGHPELVIHPDRTQLAFHGLSAGAIANLVRDKIQGRVSTRISRGDRKIDVLVRTPEEQVDEKREVLDLRVNPGAGSPLPLRSVAWVEQLPGPAEIRRVGGERAVVLSAEAVDLDLQNAAEAIHGVVKDLEARAPEAFRDLTVRVAGQREESERSLRSLLFALGIAIVLVYIVMASQFESLLHPFVILFTIPLALVGVVFVLDLAAMKLSIVVLIGVILLAGIVVNNAIVLVDAVNQKRRAGVGRDEALILAASLRLRPILMTTATTVLGLLPLAFGLGEGTEIRTPMAITVIAGLTTSTVLTLVVIPVVYSLLSRPGPLEDARGTRT